MVVRKKTAAKNKLRANNCVACGSVISVSASLCPNCHSFQSPWKNHLKFGASVVAVFVVIASLIGWIISLAPDIRRAIYWKDDLTVLSLYTDQEITLGNYGDGTIFVSRLTYGYKETPPWISNTRIINKSIKPGEIISHLLYEKDRYRNKKVSFIFDNENRLNKESWRELRDIALKDSCYRLNYLAGFHEASPNNSEKVSAAAKAYIIFYSGNHGETRQAKLDVDEVVSVVETPACRSKWGKWYRSHSVREETSKGEYFGSE